MLSSRLIDTTNKCDIIKRSLLDDLYPYTISTDGNSINYSNNTSQTITYNKLNNIGSLATSSYSNINDDALVDCWLPVFVDNDSYIDNKILSDEGSYSNANSTLSSGRLGIENILYFTPSFRSFSNAGQMSIDWILNRHNVPYAVYYGIMCWVKRNSTTNPMIIGGGSDKLEAFPNGTRLKHNSRPNDVLIKINDTTLYVVGAQRYTVSTSVSTADENTFIIQSSSLNSDSFSLATKADKESWTFSGTTTSTENLDGLTISGLTNNVKLWIPDGDCFFYYASEADKIASEIRTIPSNGFISPCLTRYYSAIYRMLTLDQTRDYANKNITFARSYRKIAHALSTSPFINEFSIRSLDSKEVRDIVTAYVRSISRSISLTTEKDALKIALKNISLYLQKTITIGSGMANNSIYLDTKPGPYSLNNNLIVNQNQLFTKLVTKYGANLLLSNQSTITVNSQLLKDNTGVVITQAMDYYCAKNTTNTLIYNNQKIAYDDTIIETVMSSTESKIDIKDKDGNVKRSIPLYDMAKPDIDGDKTLFVPRLLYRGYIDAVFMNNNVLYRPSNDSGRTYKYAMKTLSYSAGGTTMPNPEVYKGDVAGPSFDAMELQLNVRDSDALLLHDKYIESQMSYYWQQLSGPSCEFIEDAGDYINTAKPSNKTANTRYVALKIKNSGKYTIQCTINSPYGSFRKQKTIYVYDGADKIDQRDGLGNVTYVTNPLINKWYNHITNTWDDVPTISDSNPESQPIYLNKDKLRVRCSKFNRMVVSQIGSTFMPISTSFTVRELIGSIGSVPDAEVVKLDDLYKFGTEKSYTSSTGSTLSITYGMESSTKAKISAIYVEKIRSNTTDCEQCFSLYEPKLRATKTTAFTGSASANVIRYNRINKAPEGFALYKYESVNGPGTTAAKKIDTIYFNYPTITTKNSPSVKTYGGYNNGIINSLNITNDISTFYASPVPGLSRPTNNSNDTKSVAAAQPSLIPPVTGFPLNVTHDTDSGKHKLCYQRQLDYTGGGPITFTKGVLHPNSGWIPHTSSDYAIHANRSSVLKFNPGARSSFSFVGPRISNINASSANVMTNEIEANTITSSIALKMANGIQWSPICACDATAGDMSAELYNSNQKHKEYIDTTLNRSSHGYRYLHGGEPKPFERTALTNEPTYNDEFGMDQDSDTFTYSFAVTGPASLPNEIVSGNKFNYRIPTVQNFGIKDIEVKLNFLNYVNTKNLVIWLEVQPDGTESSSRKADANGNFPSPIKASQQFLDQTIPANMVSGTPYQTSVPTSSALYTNIPNNKVASYLDGLLNAEKDNPGGPLRLVLLNQEHIENNGYNFSIKFSDNASKYNVLYDQNIRTSTATISSSAYYEQKLSTINKLQNIIKHNGITRPSLAANGFSDRQACQYGRILRNNRLVPTAATFSKFFTNTLFRNTGPDSGPCPPERSPKQKEGDLNGKTVFTLKIMVLDEADDMSPNDTLISNGSLVGLSSAYKTQTSTDIFNSLCNWELILHVGDVQKFIPYTNPNLASYGNCDNLSLLDYTKNLKYPGYSFIANLENYQHLLPLANIDAPNIGIADTSVCLTNKNDRVGGGFVVKPQEFPAYAIVQILASLIPSTTGTLIGTATTPGLGYNEGFNALISYLAETRFIGDLQDSGRQIYTQSYTKYPFGSPEKILLNIKKSDSLWYSLEAFIMRYHNTPILQNKKHNYFKVQRGVSQYATEFKFDIVGDYLDLIDSKDIPEITIDCNNVGILNTTQIYPKIYDNIIINYGDLVNVSITGEGTNCNSYDGQYIALDNAWVKITNDNISNLSSSLSMLEYNSALGYNNSLFVSSLGTDISSSKVIICPTRIPYDIFYVNDTIECYPFSDRTLTSSSDIIQVQILKKGLITKNNKLYSIFILDQSITNQNCISPLPDTNTLLVYGNSTTTDYGTQKAYNMWGLNTNGYVKETPPFAGFSAHSVGSYGNVSPFVNKNLLDKNFRYNSLQSTHEILNNQNNDRIKYNKINVYSVTNNLLSPIDFTNNMSCGFAYSEQDIYDQIIYKTINNNIVIDTENVRQSNGDMGTLDKDLLKQIKKSAGDNQTSYSFMYVRTMKPATTFSGIPTSGCVSIENDYVEYTPIKFVDIDSLVTRLDTIDSPKTQSSLEDIIGDPSQTTTVLNSSNIKYILKHYNKLLQEDPADCHRPGATIANCPRLRTQNKLNKLYNERVDLIKLLDQQAVASATVVYTDSSDTRQTVSGEITAENTEYICLNGVKINKSDIINTESEYGLTRTYTRKDALAANHIHKLAADILPKIEPLITTNTDGSIDIEYKPINIHHYWINIDPKQSCVLDFASNPKVLQYTEYQCIRANESLLNSFVSLAADNNVCPEFAAREKVPQFPSEAIGDEGFSINNRRYKYWVPYNKIESKKSAYQAANPAITGWKTFTKTRYFNINADESLGPEGQGVEVTVQSTEEYLIPLVSNTLSGNDSSADTTFVSGISICQTDFGSPAGSGLLGPDYTGSRVGVSTRVQNILNLDDINTIEVQIKRIPRMLRGCDLLGTIYRYGNRSLFRQQSSGNPKVPFEIDSIGMSGPLNNSLYCWICLEHNAAENKLKYATLPPFLQHQNEMIFRSFFGSVDRIENRNDIMIPYYPWELIPYEYLST